MNFRVYFPNSYSFTDAHGNKLDLRLECFNSVDGSSRLMMAGSGLSVQMAWSSARPRSKLRSVMGKVLFSIQYASAFGRNSRRWKPTSPGCKNGKCRRLISRVSRPGPTRNSPRNGERRQRQGYSTSAKRAKTSNYKIRSHLVPRQKSRSGPSVACQALRNTPRRSMMSLKRCVCRDA